MLRIQPGATSTDFDDARRLLDGVPAVWWVGADSRPGLAEELTALGAVEHGSLPLMAVRLDQVPDVETPAGLVITEVGASELPAWRGPTENSSARHPISSSSSENA